MRVFASGASRIVFLILVVMVVFGTVHAVIADVQVDRDRLTALSTWRESHQKADDEQFKEIADLTKEFALTSIDREKRLAKLETQYSAMRSDLDSFSNKLWVVILGILAQLADTIRRHIVKDSGRKESE